MPDPYASSDPRNSGGGGVSGFLSVAQNLVSAINGALQNYLNVQGVSNSGPLTSAKLVKQGAGRVAMVSIVVAGTTVGAIYDANAAASTTGQIYAIPNAIGTVFVNIPVGTGIVVAPGTGQTVTISYS